MKYVLLFLSLSGFSFEIGDLILQPLHCSLCTAIENETDSIYSHIGIVISKNPILVAEAFEKVRVVSLEKFLSKTQRNQNVKILRNSEMRKVNKYLFVQDFQTIFLGLSYDSEFLWSSDKIYCSELIYKLLNLYGISQPRPEVMSFSKAHTFWDKYYKGNIPVQELGISPADYDESPYFREVIRL